jgi:hypothetical protein
VETFVSGVGPLTVLGASEHAVHFGDKALSCFGPTFSHVASLMRCHVLQPTGCQFGIGPVKQSRQLVEIVRKSAGANSEIHFYHFSAFLGICASLALRQILVAQK